MTLTKAVLATEKFYILIKISPEFVLEDPIDQKSRHWLGYLCPGYLHQNLQSFIHGNTTEDIVWKGATILLWPQCVTLEPILQIIFPSQFQFSGNLVLLQFHYLPPYGTWWRHQMETFSALLAICAGNSPVPGEFPAQRPVTRSFDVFFDLRLNKWLSKQSWGWWFDTLSCPLWRHRNDKLFAHVTTKLSCHVKKKWVVIA